MRKYLYVMKKGGGSESTTIIRGASKSVLVYALYSLENVLGLSRFRVFVPNLYNGCQKSLAVFPQACLCKRVVLVVFVASVHARAV